MEVHNAPSSTPAGFGSRSSCASYSLELHPDIATEHTNIIINIDPGKPAAEVSQT